MNKDTIPEGFTVKMAVVDAFPVIFFSLATVCLGIFLKSNVFLLGALLSAFAGITKVIWKFIVAIKKKNIWWLFMQMRICMPLGFILMILGVFVGKSGMSGKEIWKWFTSFPVNIFFGLGLVSFILMIIMAFALDNTNPKHNWIEQIINGTGQFFVLVGAVFLVFFGDFYRSNMTKEEYQNKYEKTVNIEETDDYYLITEIGNLADNAIIMFPGAKVEATAYIPLMEAVVKSDSSKVAVFIVKPSYNFAVFGEKVAENICEEYGMKYKKWYVAGHSLGGVEAASYAKNHIIGIDGLIMLASYSVSDLVNAEEYSDDFRVLSINASNDYIINLEKREEYMKNLPDDTLFYEIEGGNHGQFGDYGFQEGDKTASISKEEQWEEIAEQINLFINY